MPGIVVGVDGSPNARKALQWAMGQAALQQSALTVLTVHEVPVSGWTGNPIVVAGDETLRGQALEAAREAAEKAAAELGAGTPPSVTVRAVDGFAAQELISASRDADLLVVGDRGHGGFASLLLGSVSSKVVHHAQCPVVVVRA
jgi:nucleotide-binding universal stress UspA family protein